jgi:hypothetical protein
MQRSRGPFRYTGVFRKVNTDAATTKVHRAIQAVTSCDADHVGQPPV